MPTVRLAGHAIELERPASYAARSDIALAAHQNLRRAFAAALGVCWSVGSPRNPNRKNRFNGDVMAYGGAVLDHLHEIGASHPEIMAAGAVALDLVSEGLVWEDEVEAAVGNSDAAPGAVGASTERSP